MLCSIMNGFSFTAAVAVRQVLFNGEVMPIKHLPMESRPAAGALQSMLTADRNRYSCALPVYPADRDFAPGETLPIGRAFERKVFLLVENDQLVTAPAKAGEITPFPAALALGYYADPARTARAFTKDPLNQLVMGASTAPATLPMYDGARGLCYVIVQKTFGSTWGIASTGRKWASATMRFDEISLAHACILLPKKNNACTCFYLLAACEKPLTFFGFLKAACHN